MNKKISILLLVSIAALSAGTAFAITPIGGGDDISIPTTKKFYLDGGSNTYVRESASDKMSITTGGSEVLTLQPDVVTVSRSENVGQLRFYGNRAVQPVGAAIGQLDYRGNNNMPTPITYVREQVVPTDVTAGSEDAYYRVLVVQNGVLTEYVRVDSGLQQVQVKKDLRTFGNDILLDGGNILSTGDICIGTC